jgi:hypothetical protein
MTTLSNSHGQPRIDLRIDEAPYPSGQPSDSRERDHGPDGRFKPQNEAAKKPHVSLTRCAELPGLTGTVDPLYRRFLRAAASYRRARSRELARLAGGSIGAGVSALVASASYALADARYVRHLATQAIDSKERASLLIQAGRLEQNAKTAEVAAYELAVREGKAPQQIQPPWEGTSK